MLWATKSPITLAPFADSSGPTSTMTRARATPGSSSAACSVTRPPIECPKTIGRSMLLVGDERQHVGGHRLHRVVELAAPLGVAVAALVEGVDVVAVGQVQADEVPRVRRLVAAVEQHHRRRGRVAPLGEVEAHAAQDRLAGDVAHGRLVGDPEVAGALEQAGELGRRPHVTAGRGPRRTRSGTRRPTLRGRRRRSPAGAVTGSGASAGASPDRAARPSPRSGSARRTGSPDRRGPGRNAPGRTAARRRPTAAPPPRRSVTRRAVARMSTFASGVAAHVIATSVQWRRLAAFCELANVASHIRSSAQPGMTQATWGRPSSPVVARNTPSPAAATVATRSSQEREVGASVVVMGRPYGALRTGSVRNARDSRSVAETADDPTGRALTLLARLTAGPTGRVPSWPGTSA